MELLPILSTSTEEYLKVQFLFSLMVNDIEIKHLQTNNLVKFADDLIVSVPVTSSGDSALDDVTNIESWASNSRMTLNLKKNRGNATLYSFTCHTSPLLIEYDVKNG